MCAPSAPRPPAASGARELWPPRDLPSQPAPAVVQPVHWAGILSHDACLLTGFQADAGLYLREARSQNDKSLCLFFPPPPQSL